MGINVSGGKRIVSVVLAGGKGTRLFPLTLHHAKPSVPFGGKYRLIDIPISNSINSEIRNIFVIGQFLTAELHHHLSKTYGFGPLMDARVDLLTPHENGLGEKIWFLGTADAVRKTLPHILEDPAEYFLILSGDQLYNIDFQKMFSFAQATQADLTIAALPVLKKEVSRLGILQIDEEKRVVRFVEKPSEASLIQDLEMPKNLYKQLGFQRDGDSHFLASMGIYIFQREALVRLLKEDPREDFGKHLIPTEIPKQKTFAYIHRGYWEDIGTVRSFYEANMALVQGEAGIDIYEEKAPIFTKASHLPGPSVKNTILKNTMISDGCVIEGAEITGSIIGPRVHIGKGSVIKNSIIMGTHEHSFTESPSKKIYSHIGDNCFLEQTILDENVYLHDDVHLLNQKKTLSLDGDGVFIRDGIIVISKNTTIPTHFSL